MDFETIQQRFRNGTYSRCSQAFFRDILLVLTNAIAFFPKDSAESHAAQQLGHSVSAEIKHHIPTTRPDPLHKNPDPLPLNPSSSSKPNPDSLLSKHKASAPIYVSRKRSSFSAKPSTSSATFGQNGDLTGQEKKKPASDTKASLKPSSSDTDDEPPKKKEKPVTRVRSLRRSNKNISSNSSKKEGTASKPPETPKPDKSKAEGSAVTDKKRSAAVDFLKRIKRSAPAEVLRSGGNSSKGGVSGKDKNQKMITGSGKGDKGKERASKQGGGSSSSGDKKNENENSSQSKRSVGRPPKRVAETSNVVSGKRGRESGGKDKRTKKRSKK